MTVRVAINGFGRIGRLVLRSIVEHGRRDIEVVAINDLGPVETNAHLLRYDSVHGRFPGTVDVTATTGSTSAWARSRSRPIRDPAKLPHKDLNVDIAFECTGIFTAKDKAEAHLKAGAKRVLVSAPVRQRRQDHRLQGQPRDPDRRRHRRLQRLVHHQRPGPRRQGAARPVRHRARLYDHHPRLHRRPADAGYDAQGPVPRPRRRPVDDPDLDRRRQGPGPGAAGTEGQAGRLLDPRADAERLGRRPEGRRRRARSPWTRSTPPCRPPPTAR